MFVEYAMELDICRKDCWMQQCIRHVRYSQMKVKMWKQ
jgi:hypothetical protein